MKLKRYFFVTYKMSDGGAERVIARLSEELVKQGNEVAIFIYARTENEYWLAPQITIFTIDNDKIGGNKVIRGLNRVSLIRKSIMKFKPDYIIPFLDTMVYESYLAAKGLGITFVATIRNMPRKHNQIKTILLTYAFRNSDAIWLQTEEQRKYLNSENRKKAFVCPNFVDKIVIEQGEQHLYRNKILNLVTLGRLVEQKNHKMLINAIIMVHGLIPAIKLKIYGIGPEEDSLRMLIDNKHAESYIFLMGRTKNVLQVLDEADCFILSSDYEGMPNALMEAMGMGLPCISTDCPTGPRELLDGQCENDKCGMLVPIGNCEALYEAVLYMANNPQQAVNYGKKARKRIIQCYSEKSIVNTFISECEKLN